MADTGPPNKRIRYDLTTTFNVIVGSAQARERRFPVYHDLLTSRSNFFLAIRTAKPGQSVRLDDDDPDVFSLYLNCVHSGTEVVRAGSELLGEQAHAAPDSVEHLVKRERDSEHGADDSEDHPDGGRFEALIRLHLLADKLQDFEMMNSVADELVRMVDEDGLVPAQVNLVYSSTQRGNSLRAFVRDVYIHEAESSECYDFLQTSELHADFWRDISLEYFKLKNTEKSIGEVYGLKIGKDKGVNRSDYHQKQPDGSVEVVFPTTASAAGATTVRPNDRAPTLLQASGHSGRGFVAATASGITAQGHAPKAPQTSGRIGRPSSIASLVAAGERAPAMPQDFVRSSSTVIAAARIAEQHDPMTPQAPARRGRRSGTGAFVFRRPETPDVWWSVSADRFDNASSNERYRYTHAGRAQEEGTIRKVPCDRCVRRGYRDTCSSLPGERCGRCVWDKATKGDGC